MVTCFELCTVKNLEYVFRPGMTLCVKFRELTDKSMGGAGHFTVRSLRMLFKDVSLDWSAPLII